MLPQHPPQAGNDLKLDGLTREEMKKIQKSMKRPEFMGLLNEYMIEISDPKNKEEYDQYLRQMEKQGQLPKHMKLVKLNPQFCFRTMIVSSRNKSHQMKFFINMCSTEYIEKPNCEQTADQNGKTGYNWKLPNSLGKIRYDQDVHKEPCQVVECAFHPDTFVFARNHTQFMAMIISVALEGAERQLGERKETLSRDYVVLKNLKCKAENGQPALLPIRYIEGKTYNRGEGPVEPERNLQGKETKLQKQINDQKQAYEAEKGKKNEQKTAQKQQEQQDIEGQNKLIQDLDKGIQAPKFTSIYTYKTDYSEFIDGPVSKQSRKLPDSFTVEFKVPRMESIAEASTLQINDKKIILSVAQKYYIDISFEDMKVKNYPLLHGQAKAKFDKKKKTLRIIIPVDVKSIPIEVQSNEKVEEIKNEQQEPQNVVENQVWKNKVLQIDNNQETQKFLPSNAVEVVEEKKKLIEEIDEDDVIKEQQKKTNEIQEQEQQEREWTAHKFTVENYYPKKSLENQRTNLISQLNFIFKEVNPNKVVLTFYLRNYHNQQVTSIVDNGQSQFVLICRGQDQVKVSNIKIDAKKVQKIQVLKRVGYVALVLVCKNGQKISSDDIKSLKSQQSLSYYEQLIQQITVKNQQKQIQQQQQQRAIKPQEPSQNQRPKIVQSKTINSQVIDDKIPEQKVPKKQQTSSAFDKMPVQFLHFNIPFVETLN